MRRVLDRAISPMVVVIVGFAVFAAAFCYGQQPTCRVVSFEPTRSSTARLAVELTQPDASSAQRLDCTCREWP